MPYFIFIVNPTAGKGVHSESLCARIRSYFSTQNIDFEIYRTVGPQDALQFVRSYPCLLYTSSAFCIAGQKFTDHSFFEGVLFSFLVVK